jgi:transposase
MERGTRAKWAARVGHWRKSGLTAGEFASSAGLNVSTLRWWSSKLKAAALPEDRDAPVSPLTFVEMTSAMAREPIEIVLVSGVRLRIPSEFDVASVARLVDMLAERR